MPIAVYICNYVQVRVLACLSISVQINRWMCVGTYLWIDGWMDR